MSLHKHKDEKETRIEKFAKEQWQKVRAILISRYSLSEEDCADVFNESLVIMWQNMKENKVDVDCMGSKEKSNSNYFMAICRNKTMELLRSNKRYTNITPKKDQDKDTIKFLPDKIDSILALDEDYNDYQEEKDRLVRTIINNLPSPCNELLWGYYGNGNSIKESALKSGIFEIQSGLCGYSGRYTANGSRCEKICKNHHKPAKSLSERPEKGKYRSLKC